MKIRMSSRISKNSSIVKSFVESDHEKSVYSGRSAGQPVFQPVHAKLRRDKELGNTPSKMSDKNDKIAYVVKTSNKEFHPL